MSTNFPEGDEPDPSEWISQAEAARLHGVSRQAISKWIRSGRLRTFEIGGRLLVSRADILGFRKQVAGRPRKSEDRQVERILRMVRGCRPEARAEVIRRLREEYPIHPLEAKLGTTAEVILEAIDRAGPLTLRGIRGVLAESAFEVHVVRRLEGWRSLPIPRDPPFDFLLDDGQGPIRVQVKLQRQKDGRPMMASQGYRWLSPRMYVVETQRTRGGRHPTTGQETRPYRFGEFDVLAVAREPVSKRWDDFLYTVSDWLIPRPEDRSLMLKFQPVSPEPNEDWTDQLDQCVAWFRAKLKKTIAGVVEWKPGRPEAR